MTVVIETEGGATVITERAPVRVVQVSTGVPGPGYDPAEADARYVNTSGDTMSGTLIVQDNLMLIGTGILWLAENKYLYMRDGVLASANGQAVLQPFATGEAADPTHATTRKYVDGRTPTTVPPSGDAFHKRGISPLPNLWQMSLTSAPPSGRLEGLFFVCNTNRPCNRLATLMTIAGSVGTMGRMGIYAVDPTTYAMTLAVSTTNNPSMLSGSLGWKVESITGGSEVVGGVWTPTPGRMYCAVVLYVTAGTAPTLAACATFHAYVYTLAGELLPYTYNLLAQTDLPAAPGIPSATNLNAALRAANVVALFA